MTIAIWLLWAIGLAILLIPLNYVLRGLTWCSLRSLLRLRSARYVAERVALSDRIQCDGERLTYSPRAEAGPPQLRFGFNAAGWAPGFLTPETCANSARAQMRRRSAVFGSVVAALSIAWIALAILQPGASENSVSVFEGRTTLSAADWSFIALSLLTAFFLVHTIFPFSFSPGRSRRASTSARNSSSMAGERSREGVREQEARRGISEGFIGSEETLSDLARFHPLQRKVLGAENENVFVTCYFRSTTLLHLRRYGDSLLDIDTYAKAQKRILGKKNPWVLKVRYLKAVNLAFLQEWSAALNDLNAVAPIQAKVLGASHPDTLMTRSARVTAWAMLERYAEALKELQTLLPECERVLGAENQFTLSNSRVRAVAYERVENAAKEPGEIEPGKTEPGAASHAPSAPRKFSAVQDKPGWNYKRMALVAGATSLGLLLIGGGIFATPWGQQRLGASPAPEAVSDISPASDYAPIVPREQAALEPASFGSDDADVEAAPDAPAGSPVAEYASSGVAGPEGANVREAPSTTAPLVVRLDAGSSLRITGRTEAQGHRWFRVVLDDRRLGFVRDDVVVASPATSASAQVEDYAPSSPVAAGPDGANVRSAPTTGAPLLVRLDAGSDLRITGRAQASGRTWYRVVLGDGRQGFVRDDVVVPVQAAAPAQSP